MNLRIILIYADGTSRKGGWESREVVDFVC